MLDAGALDFGSITDHNGGGDYEYWWWLTEKTCDMYFIPRVFTTLYGYERSVQYPGGHSNVFHTDAAFRLSRSSQNRGLTALVRR